MEDSKQIQKAIDEIKESQKEQAKIFTEHVKEDSGHFGGLGTSMQVLTTKVDDVKLSLERVELQTLKTNGRVSKLEKWQQFVLGGMSVLGFFGAGTIIWIIQTITK